MSGAVAGPCDAGVAAAALPPSNPHPRATLAATVLGSSVAFVDGSVVNVALPALARDLGAGPAAFRVGVLVAAGCAFLLVRPPVSPARNSTSG